MNIKETIEKLGIENEEAVRALSELFQSQQDEITKLNQVKENLFDDKSKWKKEREEALTEAERIKNEALKQAGDWETLEGNLNASHKAELDKLKEQLSGRDNIILGGKREAVINDLASQFVSPDVGKTLLQNLVNTSYSESGEVVASLNGLDGQSLGNDAAKFAEQLKGIESLSPFLKGVDSSGGGSQGSGGSATASNDPNAAFNQRLKEAGLLNS
ncbi:coil containing protein [Vibrio phage 1.115.B._10N.222.49.B11]|nr:coil containing protein [Vibrio phage 1.115.A._10N.222.49.B11]AUR88551.1 coil containing protein [Vibrio phage 1.115.B._10N.222.49.B11]AUR90594.1 coil containing protein [Vibrio phage 1.148.O._10N.286.54.A10]